MAYDILSKSIFRGMLPMGMRTALVSVTMFACIQAVQVQAQTDRDGQRADCTLQIQMAVQTLAVVENQDVNAGDWQIAVNWEIPIHSDSESHRVASVMEGAQIRIEYDSAKLVNDGLRLDGFQWTIDNPIDRRDGVTHYGIGNARAITPSSEWFGGEFMPLSSLELDTMSQQKSDRRLVIRARFLPTAPPLKRLSIDELTASDADESNQSSTEEYDASSTAFCRRLDSLRQMSLQDVGHTRMTGQYNKLLQDFPLHPERAEAFFDLAHLWELTIPAEEVVPDYAKAIDLLRKSHAAAGRGSPIWITSGLHLHNRICRDKPKEAERLINSLLSNSPSTIDELRIWNARQAAAAYQDDGDEVERIGQMMINRVNSDEAPQELGADRMQYFQEVQTGIYGMLNYWYNQDQMQKIHALGRAYPYEFIQEQVDQFTRKARSRPVQKVDRTLHTDGRR